MATKTKTTATTGTAKVGLGLFAKAKDAAPAATKKTKDRKIIEVKGYEQQIAKHAELKETIENATAELKIVDGQLKEKGREVFLKDYRQNGRFPENFLMKSGTEEILYITMDKYIKVTPEKQQLLEKLEPSVIEEVTEYSFNPTLLAKYSDLIEEAIAGIDNKKMPVADKEALIVAATTVAIKKGTVKSLIQYGVKLDEVYDMIQPIVALKAGGDDK